MFVRKEEKKGGKKEKKGERGREGSRGEGRVGGRKGWKEGWKVDMQSSEYEENLTISGTCLSNFKIQSLFSFSHKMEQIQN